jgi:ribonucleoside-diphosphate reductase alpha chain
VKRLWSKKIGDFSQDLDFEQRQSKLETIDGSNASHVSVIVPKDWSQLASDILAQKYLRQKGDDSLEHDAREVCLRLARAWSYWGQQLGYFSDEEEKEIFTDEIAYALIHQMAAPNSPQWFNTGLYLSYGVKGKAMGHYYIDQDGQAKESSNAFERPQAHACFIQSVKSDLVRTGGLMDLWAREARLFKLGSGSGTNFSNVPGQGEKLPGGGLASGLMGFLKVGDASAAAIRSGGVTRRAAKMVILDMNHPDIMAFIDWKKREEFKVACLIQGSKDLVQQEHDHQQKVFDGDFNGEAYATVSGQNSNNSVRISNSFFECLKKDQEWSLVSPISQDVVAKVKAKTLWQQLCEAAWSCADPGVQFSDTINFFHTCKNDGEILASNPCSEYLFLDDTGCNLASINLLKYYDLERGEFDVEAFVHAVHLWINVLDITVSMAQYPSMEIAKRSHTYRTLGLGYANLGSLLMAAGLPYDSDEGRALAAAITSLMSASAYECSVALAKKLGPFSAWENNREHVLAVIKNHSSLSHGCDLKFGDTTFQSIKSAKLLGHFHHILASANAAWSRVESAAKVYGVRNAQVTAIAPTGTIGLLMDCDTTGIEPDYALVKHKKMVGGGQQVMVNKTFEFALKRLGYESLKIEKIKRHVLEHGEIISSMDLRPEHHTIFQTSLGANALRPMSHLLMVAACAPFVSGGISKTINLPNQAKVSDVEELYLLSHQLGVKSISIYRDGSKLSQPLNARAGAFQNCPKCGKASLVPAGTCYKCENCGETTACS